MTSCQTSSFTLVLNNTNNIDYSENNIFDFLKCKKNCVAVCSINTLLLSGAVANLVWLKLKLYIIAASITLGHPGREQIWQLSTCQSELNSLVLSQSLCQCPSPQWNYSWKHQPENGFKTSCKYFVCSPRIFQVISYCNWQMDKN